MKTTQPRIIGAVFALFACFTASLHAQLTPPTNPPSSGGPGSYLDSWSFPDTNWLSDAGYAPMAFTNLFLRSGGDGDALIMDTGGDPASLIYHVVESDNRTNLNCSVGTISLWFSADWSGTNAGGTGPGEWSRFIEAGTYTTNASIGWFSFYLSPDGCTVYLAGQTNDGNGNVYLTAPVTITNGVWNNFVVTYGPTNSTFYFNGTPVTNSPYGVAYYPDTNVLTNGFSVGSSAVDGQSQVQGMLDDISTFDSQMDSNGVFLTYQLYHTAYYGVSSTGPTNIPNAPPQPNYIPSLNFISGPGSLQFVANAGGCVNTSNIWLTNIVASPGTNQNMNVTFTIAGGYDGFPYDLFASPSLANPIHNSPWAWLGQGYHCKTYTVSLPTNTTTYLVLGQPKDTDGDGLTDAYEILVSKTNPNDSGFDANGIPEAWSAMHGLFGPNLANLDPDSDGLLNKQEYLYGTDPKISEGVTIWVASPSGVSGVP